MSVAAVVSRYRACRGSLQVLALEGKGAQDLVQSNPLAGFCLAVNDRFRTPLVVSPLSDAAHMVWRPQREIFEWLGFPGTEAVAKLGRKCVPVSLTMDRCLELRRALRLEPTRTLLAHLPRINGGVIDLVTQRGTHRQLTPQLLAEVALNHEEDGEETSARTLADTQRMARALRRREELAQIRSRRQLREVHDEMVGEYNQRNRASAGSPPFPPPLPGKNSPTVSIVPVTTNEQLAELAREQHNCVASYARGIRNGRVYVYRVTHNAEVCTLAVERNGNNSWVLQQVKGVCNQKVPMGVARLVHNWLAGENEPRFPDEMPAAGHAGAESTRLPSHPVRRFVSDGFKVTPVTEATALDELSLSDYRETLREGRMFAYRVDCADGVCAVVIRRGKGVFWQLERVAPVGTHRVRGQTLQSVADWLQRAQLYYRKPRSDHAGDN